MTYVIERDSSDVSTLGTRVYVVRFWNGEQWCHSSRANPAEATQYKSEEEARDLSRDAWRYWTNPRILSLVDAAKGGEGVMGWAEHMSWDEAIDAAAKDTKERVISVEYPTGWQGRVVLGDAPRGRILCFGPICGTAKRAEAAAWVRYSRQKANRAK